MSARSEPMAVTSGRLCAMLILAWFCGRGTVDPDLWGHLRFGLDLLSAGHLTATDPYSFTQDVPWINHEWLSELLFAAAYRAGGVLGLLLLKTAILGLAAAALVPVARRATVHARWWLLAASLGGLAHAAMTFRPHLWTVLGLAILCRVLAETRLPRWLPGLFAVWANLHGGWIVGAGVLACWMAGRAADTRRLRAVLSDAAIVVASLAATLVNPYGWRLWMFLLSTVRMNRAITEWRPLWEQADPSHAVLWAVTAALLGVSLARRWRNLTWAVVLPSVWLGVSGLLVTRVSPLFSVVTLLATSAAWGINTGQPAPTRETDDPRVSPRAPAALAVDAVVVGIVWALHALPATRCLPIEGNSAPDLAVAGVLTASAAEGRLILPFNWGEYAIWQWGPRLRVSMDGRRETVYSDHTITLQAAVAAGQAEGIDYLGRTRPEYVWLPASTGERTAEWLVANGYRVEVRTAHSFLATRADLPALRAGPPLSACFQ